MRFVFLEAYFKNALQRSDLTNLDLMHPYHAIETSNSISSPSIHIESFSFIDQQLLISVTGGSFNWNHKLILRSDLLFSFLEIVLKGTLANLSNSCMSTTIVGDTSLPMYFFLSATVSKTGGRREMILVAITSMIASFPPIASTSGFLGAVFCEGSSVSFDSVIESSFRS